MSEAQFNKAVEIVGKLPPTGDFKPSDDDKLYVRSTPPPPPPLESSPIASSCPSPAVVALTLALISVYLAVLRSVQAGCVWSTLYPLELLPTSSRPRRGEPVLTRSPSRLLLFQLPSETATPPSPECVRLSGL